MWFRYLCALAFSIALVINFAAAAEPSSAGGPPSQNDPAAPLRLHKRGIAEADAATKDLDALVVESLALAKKTTEALDQLEARRTNNTLEKVAVKMVADTYISSEQILRNATRLKQLGEPAGVDLEFRYARLQGRVASIIEDYRNLKPIADLAKKSLPQFRAAGKQKQAELKETTALITANKIPQAEQKLYGLWDQMHTMAILYRDREYFEVMKSFTDAKVAVESAADKYWRALADTALANARDMERPEYEPIQKALAAVATQLQKGPLASVGDKMLSGPQAVQFFGEEWKKLHLAAYRSRALEWARAGVAGQIDGTRLSRLVDDDSKFALEMHKGLTALMAADAQRATEAEAPALYAQYLESLAPLAALQTDARFVEAMNAGLEPLRNKSPAFAGEVAAYTGATSELLWWRRQAAKAVFTSLQKNFPSLPERIGPALISKGDFKKPLIVSIGKGRGLAESELRCPAQEVILHVWPLVQDQRATLLDISPALRKTSPEGQLTAVDSSHYAARHFGVIDVASVPPARAAALRVDLLVGEKAPPLTLEATTAVYTADNGYYKGVGGDISACYLDSLIATFVLLSPRHSSMTMLDPLASEKFSTTEYEAQMVVRCDMRPAWVYHECFVTDVPRAN